MCKYTKKSLAAIIVYIASSGLVAFAQPSDQILRELEWRRLPDMFMISEDPNTSILQVESALNNLEFESNHGIQGVLRSSGGQYRLKLAPGVHILTIGANGYRSITGVRLTFERGLVHRIEVAAKADTSQDSTQSRAQIKLWFPDLQSSETVYGGLDGVVQTMPFSHGYTVFEPTAGQHSIRLLARDSVWYREYVLRPGELAEDTVRLTQKDSGAVMSDFEPGSLTINSEPQGAQVYLNNLAIPDKLTPLVIERVVPGDYSVRVYKDLYLAEPQNVTVVPNGITPLNFTLSPNAGMLHVETDPSGASVIVQEKNSSVSRSIGTTPLHLSRFNAGTYQIEFVLNHYAPVTDSFSLAVGGSFAPSTYTLKPQFGRIRIRSNPPGAQVVVNDEIWGVTEFVKDTVNSGVYYTKLWLENYLEKDTSFLIRDAEETLLDVPLKRNIGWVSVNSMPDGADVIIAESDRTLGKTPLKNALVPPGVHTLRVQKRFFKPSEHGIHVIADSVCSPLDVALQPDTGKIKMLTIPSDVRVFCDGSYLGLSPGLFSGIPAGNHVIRLVKHEYDTQEFPIELEGQSTLTVSRNLGTEITHEWKQRRVLSWGAAAVLPGGGQFVSHQYARGSIYALTFAAAVFFVCDADQKNRNEQRLENRYRALAAGSTDPSVMQRYSDAADGFARSADDERSRKTLAMSIAIGIYILQMGDAILLGGGPIPVDRNTAARIEPKPQWSLSASSGNATLKFRIPLDLRR